MTSAILAINTAADVCSVALRTDNHALIKSSQLPRKHAQDVLPMINGILDEAGIRLSELALIALVSGPGSFTGLRIGSAVAQGLAFGANIPVISISYLAMLIRAASLDIQKIDTFSVCLHAREDEYYFASYRDTVTQLPAPVVSDCILSSAQVLELATQYPEQIKIGQGWLQPALASAVGASAIHFDQSRADAAILAELAQQALAAGYAQQDPSKALPVYLKEELEYRTVT